MGDFDLGEEIAVNLEFVDEGGRALRVIWEVIAQFASGSASDAIEFVVKDGEWD